MNATSSSPPASANPSVSAAEIDASCRVPLFMLFVSAAVWLGLSSVLGLIASIKFHSPNFLAGCSWLTYGRVHPMATNALVYGFALQAGLGVMLWIFAQLGGNRVSQPWLIGFGAKLWNFGVTLGMLAILLGYNTGFENLEMPRPAALILFAAYLMMGVWMAMTLHQRNERALQPPLWFLLAALLWFPWIYSTAHMLLTVAPVRGVMQAVVNWWFSANLTFVWMGLAGLGVLFYFIPRLTGRPLHSRTLALFAFWTLILFASWSGIPASAPVPAWMPALSAVATVMTLLTVLAVMMNIYKTVGRGCSPAGSPASGKFFAFGFMAFVMAWVMNIVGSLPPISSVTSFTWFGVAQSHLNVYGFFSMTLLGAIYYIVPQVTGIEWPMARAIRMHFRLAAAGVVLVVAPLAVGGVLQGLRLSDPAVPFENLTRFTLLFLRVSTIGEFCILAGHALLLVNLARLSVVFVRRHFVPVFNAATAELTPAEVKR